MQEMQQLADAMESQFQRLKYGGRAVVITFKPKEDGALGDFWMGLSLEVKGEIGR